MIFVNKGLLNLGNNAWLPVQMELLIKMENAKHVLKAVKIAYQKKFALNVNPLVNYLKANALKNAL